MGMKSSKTSCRAVVFNTQQPGRLNIERFKVPDEINDDEMLLKTEISGVCGSDIRLIDRPPNLGQIIPGHEIVGRIVQLGANFMDANGQPLKEGDRVGLESTIPCHYCAYCLGVGSRHNKIIDYGICEKYKTWGLIPIQDPPWLAGGWSEFVQVPRQALVHRLPLDLDLREAVLLEPLAVAIKAARKASIGCDDIVVVQGPGPLGLLTVVAARVMGAKQVYLCGAPGDEARLVMGSLFEVDGLINIGDGDPEYLLKIHTGGLKASRVIDASGSPLGFRQGLAMVARGGVYVSLGGQAPDSEVYILPDYLLRNKIDILFSQLGSGCYPASREIIVSHRFPLNKIVTHMFNIDDVCEAVSTMAERRDGCVKSALVFSEN